MNATTEPRRDRHTPESVFINQQYFRDMYGKAFVEGAPHLKHSSVGAFCGELATEAFNRCRPAGVPTILDMGAGDGMLTLPYLKLGAQVIAADASEELLQSLRDKAKAYTASLSVMSGDIFATLDQLRAADRKFDIICASSFLHHIPDYLELCRCSAPLLRPGGIFFTFQDPLRYDALGRLTYFFDRASYFWWRLFQGNYLRGIKTRLRRMTGTYREDRAEDVAEYHVVRNGVDQLALKQLFDAAGFDCSVRSYWSTQSTLFQRLGEGLKLTNTFGIIAQKRA
ncbi:MAG TPA: class I SAM-dependent methyltransferase [Verrucomicrobiae bacterium]|jgi:SAM-dependent methyltransferase